VLPTKGVQVLAPPQCVCRSPLRQRVLFQMEKKGELEWSVVVLVDVDDPFHPGMKETGVRVGANVERVRV